MENLNNNFFKAFTSQKMRFIYTPEIPNEMMVSQVDENGYFDWKLIPGTLKIEDYRKIELRYNVRFPKSFIDWHKLYYFPECDCSIIRLPSSLPIKPLEDIINNLNWYIAEQIIPQGLVPFADDANEIGPYVFDTRNSETNDDFPIRVYDSEYHGDLDGLSGTIFSSFSKLLECTTHFLSEINLRERYDVITDFFTIDPKGAGLEGRGYWTDWIEMEKAN